MKNIFKNLWRHKLPVFGIIILLIVQAYCDLSLPQYTSDIVDVGIQQKGITQAAPEVMQEKTMQGIRLFLTKEESALVEKSYEKNADGYLERKELEQETLDRLSDTIALPLVMTAYMGEYGDMDLDTILAMKQAGQITGEQLMEMKDKVLKEMDGSSSLIKQMAVVVVQEEYEACGLDAGKLQTDYILLTGGKMLLLTLLMMAVAILAGFLSSRVGAKIGMDLRGGVFHKVVSFSNNEMDKFSTASLITRSTNDIQQIQMVCTIMLRMVLYAPILGIGGILKVVSTRTGMGWIIIVAVAAIMALVMVLMKIAMPKFKIMQKLVDRLNLVSREILTGIPVIRAFSREKLEEKRFEGANQELMQTQLFANRVMTFMMPAMMLIMNAITIAIVWFGVKGIDAGNLQVGDMIAFMTYTMQIVMSFLMLTMISVMLPRAGVAADRIQEVMETPGSIRDADEVLDKKENIWNGVLEFEDVSFRYEGADEDALAHISFQAEPGKTTAIIGSTGCGKTTLVNLIPRFYDVTGGQIRLDGIDIRKLSQNKLRSMLGFVPQKGVLFSGNIASNIKFGGDFITDEMMEEAAMIAQAREFIDSKPEGYESEISQGGTNVSGGQKQRLSIARAIAKHPKVFVFDDSFSALDYKTDAALRRELGERLSDATVIIVAQRINTILHADQIIVLEDGKVAGIGNHRELLENCEAYQEIAKSQLSEAELKGGIE